MSRENVERFLDATDAFNRGDVQTYLGFLDPTVRFEPIQATLQGTYVGHEGVSEWFADIGEHYVMENTDVRYADVRDRGDRVLGIGTLRFTGKGSGVRSETPVALVVTFQDGLITNLKDYGDRGQALAAVGLSE